MNEAFKHLDDHKKDAIINAALKEFATHTYKKASTNNIVGEAQISKGLLFHYFGTKKALYDYLKDFAFTKVLHALESEMNWRETDFFKRLKQGWLIKSRVLAQYPYLAKFAESFTASASSEELMAMVAKYNPTIVDDFYRKDIDMSKFKDDVDLDKAINIVIWTFEKIAEQWRVGLSEMTPTAIAELSKEIESYLTIFKHTLYKEEAIHD